MKVGDLVCDPDIMKSKYAWCIDRKLGMIIATEEDDISSEVPPSYCDCYLDKFVVWWIGSKSTFQQCECELEVISCA